MVFRFGWFSVLVALVLMPSSAFAQAFVEASTAPAVSTDDIDLTLNAGAMLNYGNANAGGLNASGNLTIREGMELFVVEASYVWGVAGAFASCADVRGNPMGFTPMDVTFCGAAMGGRPDGTRVGGLNWTENASNLNWRLRYDHFFDLDNAIFFAHRGRIDYFAGLNLRLGLQLGYNRMLFREENQTLAMEIGVDATIDIYSADVVAQNEMLATLPNLAGTRGRLVPALRLQIAYVNHLNAALTYDTTFEVLWDVPNPAHFRFEWVNHLRSALDTWLQVSLDLTFRLDGLPPGQSVAWQEALGQTTTMFDMLTTLNLVGNLDIDGEPPPVEEAPACPACPEAEPCPVCETCAECPAAGDAVVAPATEATEEPVAAEPAPAAVP